MPNLAILARSNESKSWKAEVENFCPGVGKGKLHSKTEIEATMEIDKKNAELFGT